MHLVGGVSIYFRKTQDTLIQGPIKLFHSAMRRVHFFEDFDNGYVKAVLCSSVPSTSNTTPEMGRGNTSVVVAAFKPKPIPRRSDEEINGEKA